MCRSYQHETWMVPTVIARREMLAYNRRNFMFLAMFDIVSDLIDSRPGHFFTRLVLGRHRLLSLGDLLGIPEQMDGDVELGC